MSNFKFVIEVENKKTNEKGYLLETDNHSVVITPKLDTECAVFKSRFVAAKYIKDRAHLLADRGNIAKIVDINEAKGLITIDKDSVTDLCFILVYKKENGKNIGGFLHYDNKRKCYLNKPEQIGACCWKNEAEANQFIEEFKNLSDDANGLIYKVIPVKDGRDIKA